jgi:type VI secretion system protein ImpC
MAEKEQQSAGGAVAEAEVSLLEEIVQEMKVAPDSEEYTETKQNVQTFISQLVKSRQPGTRIDRRVVDLMVAEIDERISEQMDVILHHEKFKARESAWRSLKYLVDRVDFRENIRVNMMQMTKAELLDDFEDASEIVTSGLYRHVYTAEYGQFGGKPYGAMVANFEFGPDAHDIALLRNCASVAAMAHAPFLAGADPGFFERGAQDFSSLPHMRDLESHFEDPRFTKWNGFRESEDSRYVGLAMPRFILRAPYSSDSGQIRSFNYQEQAAESNDQYLWGNAAFALATKLADSFAKYRWCPNIIGPRSGGEVDDLPVHHYDAMGEQRTKVPTEVLVSERREYELSEQGFIGLTMRKDSDNACFFSANSCQKAKFFGTSDEGRRAEINYRLGTQLPYLFIVTRIAHYLKVMQREHIGSWITARELQKELNTWIEQYVLSMDSPDKSLIGQRPLRHAEIKVEELPGNMGWYKVGMQITPHIKYMGAFFTLSLVGKLDKE